MIQTVQLFAELPDDLHAKFRVFAQIIQKSPAGDKTQFGLRHRLSGDLVRPPGKDLAQSQHASGADYFEEPRLPSLPGNR